MDKKPGSGWQCNIGRFCLHPKMIDQNPGIVRQIMGKCAILRCEVNESGLYEYTALCKQFGIMDGWKENVDMYDVELIKRSGSKKVKIRFVKRGLYV